jgi:hypothetical protein
MSTSMRSRRTIGLPPLLASLIRAVAQDSRPDESSTADRRALALNDLARLFMAVVPLRGLDPADDLRDEIERVANRYLDRGEAEAAFRQAVDRIASIDERDAIESAHLQMIESSELAHYYAGIAAGITLADLSRGPR